MHSFPLRVAMARVCGSLAISTSVFLPMVSHAASDQDVAELKAMIQQLRHDYEARIDTLEARLTQAEKAEAPTQSEQPSQPVSLPAPTPTPVAAASAFNPSIGVVLSGALRSYSNPAGNVPGFLGGGESAPGAEGLSLGESEISLSADIDNRFSGKLTASLADDDGETSIELEEAFLEAAIGNGMRLKGGRFLSNIGYLNPRHAHTDDFADRPLPYRLMLNGAYKDDGVGFAWVAPTDRYLEFGGEYLRGGQFPAAGAGHAGMGAWTAYLTLGDDIGFSGSWQAGLSYLDARADERLSGDPGAEDSFSGDSHLWIADAIWKWAPNGDPTLRNFKLQGEFFWRDEDGDFTPNGGTALPYSGRQRGWYVQAVYQFMPQWRFGSRIAGLNADDPGAALAGGALDPLGHDPRDYSLMLDWSNSEFSRLRLQYTYDKSTRQANNAWTLQYIMSLGAHGAHTY